MPTKAEAILWNEDLPVQLTAGHTVAIAAAAANPVEQREVTLFWVMDGGGSALSTGVSGDLFIEMDLVLRNATLLADQSGSLVVDIWRDSYANYPPTDADSITALAPPTISSATKSVNALEGWSKNLYANDVLRFNIDSCTTITRATLALRAVKV
jgi:hypothetical protein